MKPIHELIRDTGTLLKLSGREYKTLVESSRGYDGDDYNRRVVNEMVRLSEEELNVPLNQLLAKWDLYMVEIQEGSFSGAEKSFSSEILERVQTVVTGEDAILLSLGWFDGALKGLPGYREAVSDWRKNDIDIDEYNAVGTVATWGTDVHEEILGATEVVLYVHLDETMEASSAPIISDSASKTLGKLTLGAQATMFRALNFADVFADNREVKLVIHGSAGIWGMQVNKQIVNDLIWWMGIDERSAYAHASDFNMNDMFGGLDVLLILGADNVREPEGRIELPGLRGEEKLVFFSKGSREIDAIKEQYEDIKEDLELRGYREITADGDLSEFDGSHRTGGQELGFLSLNGVESIETLPRTGSVNIPILEENIESIISYFGLTQSLIRPEDAGLGIPTILTGKPGYEKVIANSLPLFLYGPLSNRRDRGVLNVGGERIRLRNNLVIDNPELGRIVESSKPFMDFEASSMFNELSNLEETTGKTVHDYLADNPGYRSRYDGMVSKLKTHINSNYDHFVL